ncbi:hypothetical protein niasHS_013791 [Heterodera schachtii]|uniref:Uncharacterized protein n=1 Tax=Heterodera schachtii TaxID=97005 RepID=A0ABD2IJ02_HETSC
MMLLPPMIFLALSLAFLLNNNGTFGGGCTSKDGVMVSNGQMKQEQLKKKRQGTTPKARDLSRRNSSTSTSIGSEIDINGGTKKIRELIRGNSIHINNQNNKYTGESNGGGIQIGGMSAGGTSHLNIGGNRNVGGPQEIGSPQRLYNRSNTGDLANALRQQRTEDNHISINGQIYSVDGPNVNVEEAIEANGTSEGEVVEEAKDMALALAMSRRQFWHQMTDEWNCKNGKLQKPKEEMFSKANDGQHQTGQYFAKINGQSYEIETPDIRVEVQMVKKHPLIVDSEKEEHLLINDEDRGVLPPGNHLDIEAPGCIINGNTFNHH